MKSDQELDQIMQKYNLKPVGSSQSSGGGLRGKALLDSLNQNTQEDMSDYTQTHETPDIGEDTLGKVAGTFDKFMKPASKIATDMVKSFAETGSRQLTNPQSPISPLHTFDPSGAITKPLINKIPEKVGLPLYGETSLKYSEDPWEKTKQIGEDVLNTWTPTGAKVAVKAVEERAANKIGREALNVVSPELNKLEREAALREGRGVTKGILGTTKINPSPRELEMAKVVENIVDSSKPLTKNIANVRKAITNTAEELKQGIKDYDVQYNLDKLKSNLSQLMNSEERQLTFAGDDAAKKAYQSAIDTFMKIAKRNSSLLSGLLDSRKLFDRIAERSLSGAFEKDAPRQLAFRDIRTAVNDFIAGHVPDNVPVQELLKKQSLMYEAIENMAGKEARNVGKNVVTRAVETIKKHPIITTGAGLYGAYQTGKHLGR